MPTGMIILNTIQENKKQLERARQREQRSGRGAEHGGSLCLSLLFIHFNFPK